MLHEIRSLFIPLRIILGEGVFPKDHAMHFNVQPRNCMIGICYYVLCNNFNVSIFNIY